MSALKKILVVDDIVYNRLLINEIVESAGYEFCNAGNGSEAIQLLRKHKVDLVFMDLEMPIMNGFETTRFIRNELHNENSDVPIIAITAHAHTLESPPLLGCGFNDLLKKPYTADKIDDFLDRYLK